MGQKAEFHTVAIPNQKHREFQELANLTGHKIGFHLNRAWDNYLSDEAPVWREAAEKLQAKLKKK